MLAAAPPAHAQDPGVLARDAKRLLGWRSVEIAGAGLALAAAVHPLDDHLDGRLEGQPLFEMTSDLTNLYGSSTFNVPAGLGLWLFARATGRSELEGVSFDLLRALGFVQALVAPVKYTVGRKRPDGSDTRSFPSGHTANAVAIAAVLERHYGWRAGLPLYVWSGFTAAGRMEEDKHFLSDVVAGAAAGYIVGRAISRSAGGPGRVVLSPFPGGAAITVRIGGAGPNAGAK